MSSSGTCLMVEFVTFNSKQFKRGKCKCPVLADFPPLLRTIDQQTMHGIILEGVPGICRKGGTYDQYSREDSLGFPRITIPGILSGRGTYDI